MSLGGSALGAVSMRKSALADPKFIECIEFFESQGALECPSGLKSASCSVPPWRIDKTCVDGVAVAFKITNVRGRLAGDVLASCKRDGAQCPWQCEDS